MKHAVTFAVLVCLATAAVAGHDREVLAAAEARLERLERFERAISPPVEGLSTQAATPCVGGVAAGYPCSNVDLLAFMPLADIGGGNGNDIWGWTDPLTGREYALMGRTSGTSFVDVTDPVNPVYLGNLPPHTSNSTWRDIKVHADHAFIVSEAFGHGMQVFDLTELRSVTAPPVTFAATAHYGAIGSAHNVAINEATGFAYVVGTSDCGGGPHFVDVSDPVNPTFAGCIVESDYTHDTQCVDYAGPDQDYQGREICFNSNENRVNIVDATDKSNAFRISTLSYSGSSYVHQAWLTEDQQYLLVNDELDEQNFGHNTRTRVLDVRDLDAPALVGSWDHAVAAIDHNNYTHQGYAFQANYRAGLRILDLADVATAQLVEVGFFDVYPANDAAQFDGAWSVYPYFDSGTVVVSSIELGLFILRPVLAPTFDVGLSAGEAAVCAPGDVQLDVTLTERNGYAGTATLAAAGLPAGSVETFDTNPLVVPGSTTMTISAGAGSPGSFAVDVVGDDGTIQSDAPLALFVADQPAGPPSAVAPADGAVDLPLKPTLSWTAGAQALDHVLQVAEDAAFTSIVFSETVRGMQQTLPPLLEPLTEYHWRVAAANPCGQSSFSAARRFTTRDLPSILLVDDDDDSPDVRATYTAALDALGEDYDVWDTQNSDDEPNALTLSAYDTVIWFTGDEFGGAAGPGAGAEGALDAWLSGSGCLVMLSQDYHYDRGLTSFIQDRLGASAVSNDVGQTGATGSSIPYDGLGPYTFSFPYTNYTDDVTPGAAASVSFTGSTGNVGIHAVTPLTMTNFWTFGLEGLATEQDRLDVLGRALTRCRQIADADGDADGATNGDDCAPADAGAFAVPGRPVGLTVAPTALAWSPPAEPGGSATIYDLLRSDDATDFSAASCLESGDVDLVAADPATPAPAALFAYLVRARNACGESGLGRTSLGDLRDGPACP